MVHLGSDGWHGKSKKVYEMAALSASDLKRVGLSADNGAAWCVPTAVL